MKNKFLSQDFVQKIDQTFVRYKGECFFARVTEGIGIAISEPHNTANVVSHIDPYDDELDLSSIPLGYFNLMDNKVAGYAFRIPMRKYKQGVSTSNTRITILVEGNEHSYGSEGLFTKGFTDSQRNKFPDLLACEKLFLKERWASVAISQEIGLCKPPLKALPAQDPTSVEVFFRRDKVGTYSFATNVLEVPDSTFAMMMSKILSKHTWRIV